MQSIIENFKSDVFVHMTQTPNLELQSVNSTKNIAKCETIKSSLQQLEKKLVRFKELDVCQLHALEQAATDDLKNMQKEFGTRWFILRTPADGCGENENGRILRGDGCLQLQVNNLDLLRKELNCILDESLTGRRFASIVNSWNENIVLKDQLNSSELKVREQRNELRYITSAKLYAEKNSKRTQLDLSNLAKQYTVECNKTKTLQAEKQQLEKEKQDREDAVKQREKQLEDRLEVCRAQMEVVKFRVQIVFPKRETVLPLDVYPWTTYKRFESRIGKHPRFFTGPNVPSASFRLCRENGSERLWLDSEKSLLENQVHDGDELLLFFDSTSS